MLNTAVAHAPSVEVIIKPPSPEIERIVLGIPLIRKELLSRLLTIPLEAFYYDEHRVIRQAIGVIFQRYGRCTFSMLQDELQGKVPSDVLVSLLEFPRAVDYEYYVDKLLEGAERRQRALALASAACAVANGETPDLSAVSLLRLPSVQNLEELMSQAHAPSEWLVSEILPGSGVYIIAGKPKVGKTYLALQLAIAIASGNKACGWWDTRPLGVLYVSLEEAAWMLRHKIESIQPENLKIPLYFVGPDIPRADEGGIDVLRALIYKLKVGVVIIDPFVLFRPRQHGRAASYDADYDAVMMLKRLSMETRCAFIIVHHTRKAGSEDPIDTVLGTTGITGAVDGILILRRSISENTGTLHVSGRTSPRKEYVMRWDRGWYVLAEVSSEYNLSMQRQVILGLLAEVDEAMTPLEIAQATEIKYGVVRVLLSRMVREGFLVREKRGFYRLARAESPLNVNGDVNPVNIRFAYSK